MPPIEQPLHAHQATLSAPNARSNPSVLKALGEFGITDRKLKAGLTEMNAVEAANLVQEKEKGEA